MLDDSALITAARVGVQRAYASLFRRHHRRAVREARKLVVDPADAQDVVAAGFAATFLAIRKGGGPRSKFRAYLLNAVRVAAGQPRRASSAHPTLAGAPAVRPIDISATGVDPAVRDGFRSLPERWQEALWRTEIEGVPALVLAADLAISTRLTDALLARARHGFGTAYVLSAVGSEPHAWASERLELLREGALDPRTRDLVELHVEQCSSCRGSAGARRVPAAAIGVILLAGGVVAPVTGSGAAAPAITALVRLRPSRARARRRMTTRVATASAATVAIVGTLLAVALSGHPPSSAPRSTGARRSPPTVDASADPSQASPRLAAPNESPPTTALGSSTSSSAPAVAPPSVAIPAPADETSSTDVAEQPAVTTVQSNAGSGSSVAVEAPGVVSIHGGPSPVPSVAESVGPPEVPTADVTSSSPPLAVTESTIADSQHPEPPTSTAVSTGAVPASTAPSAPVSSTSVPSIHVPATTTRTTRPAPPTTKPTVAKDKPVPSSTKPPSSPTPVAATAVAPTTPTTALTNVASSTSTPAPVAAANTTTAAPPVYGGTLSLGRNGQSSRTAAVLANASGGLPAGTTLTFTFSDDDPNWTVRFTSISMCAGLPTAVTGDKATSLTVRCLVPDLAKGRKASVTFVVDDPSHNGNDNDAVRARVAVQRPGGPVAVQCDGPGC